VLHLDRRAGAHARMQVSFAEHEALAKEHDGAARWGWRHVNVGRWEGRGAASPSSIGSGVGAGGAPTSLEKETGLPVRDGLSRAAKGRTTKGLPDDLDWVREDLTDAYEPMARAGETAQVHPRKFTRAMLALAQDRGAQIVRGRALEIVREKGAVAGVRYAEPGGAQHVLPAATAVLCAGAWAPALLPALPIAGTRAHSITIAPAPGTTISPYALFTEITLAEGGEVTPEIYARADEVYACGPGDDSALPAGVDDVVCDADACEAVRAQVAAISDELAQGQVTARQACFLPVVRGGGGGPIIGAAPKVARGLYVGAGHTCWVCFRPRAGSGRRR
jgi:glycine/D-amino acid oxidase-like deaminating enzyme